MAERPPALQKCETVPERESLDKSESDARQRDLQQRAQDSPPDPEKPGRSPAGKNSSSHQPGEHEDVVSEPALSSRNLKKNVCVVSSPEKSRTDQDALATSMSQASGFGTHVLVDPTDSKGSPATPFASAYDVSSASRTLNRGVNGNAATVSTVNQTVHCHNKHMGGAALDDIPKRVADAVRMRYSRAGCFDRWRVSPRERELGIQVRDEDGAIDLTLARQARRWNSSCCACREKVPETTMMPCGHCILCRRCFVDPHLEPLSRCPLCNQEVEGLTFTNEMKNFLLRRSAM